MVATPYAAALLASPLLAASRSIEQRQANTTIPSQVESGIQTECKTCPWSLCPNTLAYEYGSEFQLTCWTEGTEVNGDNTWLRTEGDCYVTQWDIIEYAGDYRTDLPHCGAVPEVITRGPSRTIYHTECNIIPEFVQKYDRVKMYKPEVDLTLTCYTHEGSTAIENPTWYKTLSNCYVPDAQIEWVDPGLDFCGPIPFMEKKMREPDPVPEPEPSVAAAAEEVSVWEAPANALRKRWLYTTRIGGDSAPCTREAKQTSEVVRDLPFGAYLIVQCASFGDSNETGVRTIYLLTTDFCWVKDSLSDPTLTDSVLRSQTYPACEDFVDTEV